MLFGVFADHDRIFHILNMEHTKDINIILKSRIFSV